ncbi:delta endotoxin C-terminal domain-containing protein [Bacillus thuringiensis]|uniref:delta endotoxin C-terminal domain-containing protein n=1 Tax=Bacillus thuringiensis TaxID=1428 RepID=UPI00090291EC|nr:delta endotoxin C-terminal domain-containing protein [Bacillus thuringiensis]
MAQLPELQAQSFIPYNVLANPVTGNSAGTDWGEWLSSLKEAWTEFQKTGSDKFLQSVLSTGYDAAQGGSFNYIAVLQAGVAILGTVLGAEFPGITAIAVPALTFLIKWVWPKLTGGSAGESDTQKMLDLIDKEIQQKLDQALSQQDINNWRAYLTSIFEAATNLSQSIIDAQFTGTERSSDRQPRVPTSSDYEDVYTKLNIADAVLSPSTNNILTGNFDVLAIPYYTIGATVRITAYQSFVKFANQWIDVVYPDQTSNTWLKAHQNLDNAKDKMIAMIQQYTANVLRVFTDPKNMPPLGKDKKSINAYNKFVRGMVISGLDLVAVWPSLYPDDYQVQTDLEKTRVIFSDLIGKDQTISNDVTLINMADGKDGSGAFNQHAAIDLNSIFYYHEELSSMQLGIHDGSRGNTTNCYDYGIIANYPNHSYFYGDLYSPSGDATFSAPLNVLNAQTQYSSGYVDSEFIYNSDPSAYGLGCHILGGCTKGDCYNQSSCSEGFGYSCNTSLPSQKINAFYPFKMNLNRSGTSDKLGLMYSLVPLDLSPNNVFGELDSDTRNVIGKGFPAEKGTLSYGRQPMLVREWVNGANAVKLSDVPLTLQMTNMTSGKYYIRVRYANTSNAEISINQQVYAGNQNVQNGGWSLPSTTASNVATNFPNQLYITGINGNYVLEDITWGVDGQGKPITIPSGDVTVTLSRTNMSQSGDLFIDRVELVPAAPQSDYINYSITSQIPNCNNFDTIIWDGNGAQRSTATVTVSGLPDNNGILISGLSSYGWQPLQDVNGHGNNWVTNGGPFTLSNDHTFTAISICGFQNVSSGKITGKLS